MVEKPSDCTCQYPEVMARNTTGHATDCPAHKRLIARQEVKVEGKPESLPLKPVTEPAGFHAHGGWFFERLTDGSVRITHRVVTGKTEVRNDSEVFTPDAWASIVASVCRYGETAQSFQMAQAFHMAH